MTRRIVVATAIPGSSEEKYLERFCEYAEERGKKVSSISLGHMLFEQAGRANVRISSAKVLNLNPYTMQALRGAAFERAMSECDKFLRRGHAAIWNMHALLYWRHSYAGALDTYYLNELNPELYVNFLDDVDSIVRQLASKKRRDQWEREFFSQGTHKNYVVERILDWQSAERAVTKMWAQHDSKRFFTIPTKSSPSILYRLLFEPWRKIFYMGMPLTLLTGTKYQRARERINKLAKWLERYVTLIDPRYVEPLSKKHLSVIYPPMYDHVVERDLMWLIPQCDGMFAFFPTKVFSSGVTCEMREVHETCGEVCLIYPPGPISPFLFRWTDQPVFRNEKDFRKDFLIRLGSSYLKKVEAAETQYKSV